MVEVAALSARFDVETAGLRRDLARVKATTKQTARSMETSFKKVNVATVGLSRSLAGIRNLVGALGAAFVFTKLIRGVSAAVKVMEDFEVSQRQTAQLLQQTGQASGKTADEIERLAREIGLATLASTSEVRAAANQLLTFRSIAGATFDRTLQLSQDLASLGFGSISTAAVQLAKALESPAENLSNLRRVGVSFSKDQEALIKNLVATGRAAEGQAVLLDALEAQVGGAGRAAATGLSGAFDSLSENLQTYTIEAGKASGVTEKLRSLMNSLADSVGSAAGSFTLEGQIAAAEARIRALRETSRLEAPTPMARLLPSVRDREAAREVEINDALRERADLLNRLDFQRKRGDDAAVASARVQAEISAAGSGGVRDTAPALTTEMQRRADLTQLRLEAERESVVALAAFNAEQSRALLDLERSLQVQTEEAELLVKFGGKETEEFRVQAELMRIKNELGAEAARNAEDEVRALEKLRSQLEVLTEAQEKAKKESEDVESTAKDLGLTFTSAFEEAVLAGNDLRSVLQGLLKDIAAIILRKGVTEPGADFLGDLFKDVIKGIGGGGVGGAIGQGGFASGAGFLGFGGPRAHGGPVQPNKAFMVGEQGPELFVPNAPGAIVPSMPTRAAASGGGGGGRFSGATVIIDARGADAAAVNRLEQNLARLDATVEKRAIGAMFAQRRLGGSVSRTFG